MNTYNLTVTRAGTLEIHSWEREVSFSLDGKNYEATISYSEEDGYYYSQHGGDPIQVDTTDYDFLYELDTASTDWKATLE